MGLPFALPAVAPAQSPAALAPFTLARSAVLDLPAPSSAPGQPGRQHRIFLSWPEDPPPPGGWPVLYLLDGNVSFPIAVATARPQEMRAAATGVSPAVLVGLGHAGDAPYDHAGRTLDYTPAAPGAPPGSGGAEDFLSFIADRLMPEIARRFPVNPARQAIFGHSFGGLFVLHALFSRPGLFRRSIAASPSIWWQNRVVLAREGHFAALPRAEAARLGLLLLVGGEEEPAEGAPPPGLSPERLARLREARMVSNARDLATRLAATDAEIAFLEFPGENHGSVVPGAISRALRFGLRLETG